MKFAQQWDKYLPKPIEKANTSLGWQQCKAISLISLIIPSSKHPCKVHYHRNNILPCRTKVWQCLDLHSILPMEQWQLQPLFDCGRDVSPQEAISQIFPLPQVSGKYLWFLHLRRQSCKGFLSLQMFHKWKNEDMLENMLNGEWKVNDSQPKETSDPKLADERPEARFFAESKGRTTMESSEDFSRNSPLEIKAFNWRCRMKTCTYYCYVVSNIPENLMLNVQLWGNVNSFPMLAKCQKGLNRQTESKR